MKSPVINLDPRLLKIGPHVDEKKVANTRVKPKGNPIVVLPDNDLTFYVADGNHRATRALHDGIPVPGVIVDDEYACGRQSALDRVLGIFFRER